MILNLNTGRKYCLRSFISGGMEKKLSGQGVAVEWSTGIFSVV